MTTVQLGPRMGAVLDAQQRQRDALRYPDISGYAAAVAAFARQRRCDLLWPVDVGAHKLMGAVELVTCGAIEVRSFASIISGRSVLFVASVGVSGLEMALEARAARAAGAAHVCGAAIDPRCCCAGLEDFVVLSPSVAATTRIA
jgi:hypothetical protein